MGFWSSVAKIGGYVAAPFTGGASILVGNAIGSGIDAFQKRSAVNNANKAVQGGAQRSRDAYGALQPYMQAGSGQLGSMSKLAGMGPGDIHKLAMMDPGFEHRLEVGERAVNRSAAAKGTLLGMGTMKDLTRFAQGEAAQSYGDAYNRAASGINDQFGRQSAIADYGYGASGQYAQGISGIEGDAAGFEAGSNIQKSNIWGDLIGGITNDVGGMITAGGGGGGSSYGNAAPGEYGIESMPPGQLPANITA